MAFQNWKKVDVIKSNKSENSLPFEPMMVHLDLRAFCTRTIWYVGFWWAPCGLPGWVGHGAFCRQASSLTRTRAWEELEKDPTAGLGASCDSGAQKGTWDIREEAGGGCRWLGSEAGAWLCLEQRRQVTRWSWPLPGGDLGFLGWLVCSPQLWLGPFHIWVRVWGLSRHRLSSGCCAWPGHLWFYAADIDHLPATCQAEF